MSPITHFLLSWVVAKVGDDNNRRERAIITLAGVALVCLFAIAIKGGISPLEMVSESANRSFVATLRRPFHRSD